MRRASVAAAGFALVDGSAADPSAMVHVAPAPDRFGRILLACVEPLDLSPRGMELAAVALHAMRESFAETPGSATDALLIAFAAANAAVIAENRPLATGRWARRIGVGATGVVLAGREIAIAQAPPSQAILVQDGQVYAFPDIASWRGDYTPDTAPLECHPLGIAEELTPRLYHSEAAAGDLIALCQTSVGRALGGEEDAAVELYGGSLLTADLEGSVDRLERLLARHHVADAFAVLAAVTKLPRQPRLRPVLPRRQSANVSSHSGLRAETPAMAFNPHHVSTVSPIVLAAPAADDDRPPAFEGVRDIIISAAERASSVRRKPAPKFDARQRAMAAPGALSVSRYRESSGMPAEWRANLPRGPGVHVPARLLAVSLAVFLTIGGTGYAVGQQRDREARVEASLATADWALQSALDNPGSATSLVAEAEAAVTSARDAGASGEALTRREEELARVRDHVWGVQRLINVERIGALPHEVGSGPIRLALSGQTLFIAAGNLYELDPEGGRLITLLSKGDAVAGGAAGDIRDVSIDGGTVVAFDGTATFVRDKTGQWQRRELALEGIGKLKSGTPVISWGDADYGLSWDGNIVRFEQTAGGPLAEIWAGVEENPDLEVARDLAIDGRIHVLLQDGRTLTFSRGALTGTVSPFVVPALTNAAFLAQSPFATDFYIVDPQGQIGANVGRIIRTDAEGSARQYLMPPAVDAEGGMAVMALAAVQDMAIDDMSGTVYWVSDGELWQANFPLS